MTYKWVDRYKQHGIDGLRGLGKNIFQSSQNTLGKDRIPTISTVGCRLNVEYPNLRIKMKIKEFGETNNEKILLLHGGGLSWWSLEPIIRILSKDFHVITPVIDGHGEDGETTFISISTIAEKIISYIDENCGSSVKAICGLSIGAQIVVDILSKRYDIARFSIIESALVKPVKFLNLLYLPIINISYPLIKYKWYSRLQSKVLFVPDENLDKYYEDSCKISKESLINITLSNGLFKLDPNISNTKTKVLILVGEKEIKNMKQSAIELHKNIKESELVIVPKSGHGEISLLRPIEYCNYLCNLLGYKMDVDQVIFKHNQVPLTK